MIPPTQAVRTVCALCALLILAMCAASALAQPQGKSVAEEILDILKARGQISDAEYQVLVKKAREEKQAWISALEQVKAGQAPAQAQAPAPAASASAPAAAQAAPAAMAAAPAQGNATTLNLAEGESPVHVTWKDGLTFKTKDDNFRMKLGARLKVDAGWQGGDQEVDDAQPGFPGHGAQVRLARINLQGHVYNNILFRSEVDFAGGVVSFKDAYVGFQNIPYVGRAVLGNNKEPLSLEVYQSSMYPTFMETSLASAFIPVYNLGPRLNNAPFEKRMTWAVGAYQATGSNGKAFSNYSDVDLTGRVTGLPWFEQGGRRLVHLGLGYSHQFRAGSKNPVQYRSRPEINLTNVYLVDTGPIDASGVNLFNVEGGLNYGPLNLAAEFHQSLVDVQGGPGASFYGGYGQAAYFLTGEFRPYDQTLGVWGKVVPLNNFDPWDKGGWGAWQVAARYSMIDLTDNHADIRGGRQQDLTLGVNWFLNPVVRLTFNYVHGWLYNAPGLNGQTEVNAAAMRAQFDF